MRTSTFSIAQLSFGAALAACLLAFAAPAAASSYKCKGADGKVEYSDRPCATDKQNLLKPVDTTAKPAPTPMEKLTALFTEYEAPLCEREKLAAELEKTNRSTAEKRIALKPKYDRMTELAETQITFQSLAAKITQPTGASSAESTALRKFQSKIKLCPTVTAATPAAASVPVVAPPATPAPVAAKPAAVK